ncbi:TPA: YSIRK-type signal peptide-containing protein [Streptococcus suis]|uniref:ZmpA/ZmpB/ZmpC family metallo-endopeptidase n=1 Tax=Streptococcus suis TaxID=1307 RepID=UPI0005B8E412|nr:ZmpA/ZmpB/ZmpC family metallo-endopeptidase [Streptococcus suis]NQN64122.1 YSIRK-type signal peptide-containing protein [Streptococcus suis]NQO52939.1 YSIRK-type signal peptide-containing protein [Streptococcus suis]NQR54180.1 YSIRK-type signal peptide-containing protein [Streptococcus suis]CYV31045.1 Zinc metalloprotease zmpC [Streptococcus suis]HEL1751580.1 YSIRK-type signal peptide-containing protein [Streptococcus suis]
MNLHFLQKKQHFGIRKLSIGVVSVALAISFSVAGGQAVAAQEATQANVSSQQTSQPVTDQANQLQETNKVTVQIPETVGSSLNQATQENPAQESQLVEVEPAIQKEVVSQDISAPQAALPAEARQEQTTEEQSNTAGDESTLTVKNSYQIIEQVEPKSIQTAQEPAGSTDEVTQPVQPTETAAVEEVVQPVLRSARRARSVAVTEVAKLPLDAQGQLMPSVNGETVHQYQVVYSDGSSQLVAAQTTDQTQANSDISNKVNQIKQELSTITYDSLYPYLNHQVRFLDDTEIVKAYRLENGNQEPTPAEKQKIYMDLLDMRASFNRVQNNLQQILTGVFEKANTVDLDRVRAKKEQILAVLSYLDRRYSFTFGNYQAKDLILYHPQVFGGNGDSLDNLLNLANVTYQDLTMAQSATAYQRKLAPITGQADLPSFIEKGVSLFESNLTAEAWFKKTSKAHIVESTNGYASSSLYEKMKTQAMRNHLLPLLTLSSDSIYAISTSNTVNYGLKETYIDPNQVATTQATFQTNLVKYAEHQQEFLNFWHRMTQRKQEFANHPPIIVVDTVQKYGQPGNARALYSPKFGSNVLQGVGEFIRPLNLYSQFTIADAQANGSTSVNLFLKKSLTDDGQSAYTHELTHILDKVIWFNGFGRRTGQGAEVFARGLFESINNSLGTAYDPSFNLNTAYTLTDNRTQNSHPSRFQTTEDMKTYMQGILDVVYTLDYAEAQSILKQNAADRAVLLNKISLVPTTAANGQMTDSVTPIDENLAASLTSVSDFVDQSLISGRYKFDGLKTRGTARTNSYYVIPLFEPIYAGLQNNAGSGGDISFRRNAYDILGEYGYENGMVAYLSNQHANDQAALNAIMPEYGGNLATFKKAMFDRRIGKIGQLNPTAVAADFSEIQSKMDQAIADDLAQLKTNIAAGSEYLSTRVSAVRNLKTSIYQAYLAATDEFRTSIYQEVQARDLYVTNGAETSTEGQGTETNPYQSLSYAISQAKDGDTIKLVSDVQHRQETPFLINKAVTIDGQGHRLTFRGPNVELGNDVTFANMTLNMIVDASQQATIYANGYHLTFDRVSTTISQAQSNLRPSLVAGSRTGDPAGSHGQITITNGSSDTRFNTIYAGNADSTSSIPVTISILSDFVSADNGIILSGANGALVEGPVAVISKSSSLKSIDGSASLDNTVTIDTARVYGLNLQNIQSLSLVNRADVTLSEQVSEISTGVELASGTQLIIANAPVTLGNLSGQGKVIVPATASLAVTGSIEGTVEVLVRGFEYNLSPHVDKVFVTAEGGFADTVRIALENQSDRFSLSNEGISYRLTEPTQTPKDIQVQLRFKDGERVVKEESLTLPAGSSVTDLGDRLPQLDLGHYEISSSFDQTQLNNLQTSQIIDIPLELITPALPVKVFDKTAVTGLELVTPPTKTDYRPAETVDLSGLQVKLVDNQGLSKTITPDQFGEYGVEVVPVTLTPQVTSLQVRKDNHELTIPIRVIPWKADVYAVTVGEKHVYETDDNLTAVETAILAKVQVDAQAGSVEKSFVNPLPTTLGEHNVPVLVRFDDGSQKRVSIQVVVQQTAHGEGVTHELPIGVLSKSDRYQAQVIGTAQVLPTGTSEATKAEILKQISLPTEAGQVDFEVVGSLPQSSGDYSITVRVVYDDRSQEEVAVPLHILFVENGKGVTHELPVGVLPKSDLYQAQVTGSAQVLPTSTSEATTAEILKQISLPTEVGQVDFEVVGSLPQSSGDYSITVRVIYDDRSQDEIVVPLHIFKMENGKGVTHELPIGVLPKSDRYQPQVTGEARVLPASSSDGATAEIVKQISLPAEAGQFDVVVVTPIPQSSGDYSMIVRVVYDDRSQDEIVVPLHIFKMENGKGVTHELPIGVLPKSDRYQPQVTGEARVLPASSSDDATAEIVKQISLPTEAGQVVYELVSNLPQTNGDYPITVRVIYDDRSQDEIVVPLHIFKMENGKGVTHELPVGVLPPLETTKGDGVTHELPVGVLPPLETTKGDGVTHELPIGVLPSLEVALEKGLGENSPKPAAKEMAVSVSVEGQQKFAKGQLPKTGDRNNLLLVGVMLAIFNLIFWMPGKKPHQVEKK